MAISKEAEKIMIQRFGKDSVISLATCTDQMPAVRYVNAYYDHNAFYVLTYALSNKMKHIETNPNIAIAGEWFTARGRGENLGFFGREENKAIAEKMETEFADWIHNGHNNLEDENTIILKIHLTEGVLFSHGTRYDLRVDENDTIAENGGNENEYQHPEFIGADRRRHESSEKENVF